MKCNNKLIQDNVLPRLLQVLVAVGVQRAKLFAGARGVLALYSLLATGGDDSDLEKCHLHARL